MEVTYWCSPTTGKPECVNNDGDLYDVWGGVHYGFKLITSKEYGYGLSSGSEQRYIIYGDEVREIEYEIDETWSEYDHRLVKRQVLKPVSELPLRYKIKTVKKNTLLEFFKWTSFIRLALAIGLGVTLVMLMGRDGLPFLGPLLVFASAYGMRRVANNKKQLFFWPILEGLAISPLGVVYLLNEGASTIKYTTAELLLSGWVLALIANGIAGVLTGIVLFIYGVKKDIYG